MKNFFIAITTISIVMLTSCATKKAKEPEDKPVPEATVEMQENTQVVSLTDSQIKSIGIEVGSIEQKQLTASLKANGVLRVPNQNKATINSVYSGVIRTLLVQPGNNVRKGQVIATVANPEFVKIQSDYLDVSAKIVLAELEVNRQRELNAGNAGALKNLQSAETELRTLRTSRSTYEQQIRLMGINPATLGNGKLISVLSITSPISGVVSDVKVAIGSFIDVTTIVAEVVDNSQLHLDLFVYEKDLARLKDNQLIHFTLTNNPGKEYDAQIYSLGSSFEGESKAVTVHARVQGNISGLIDGMNITAVISLDKSTVPAVPSESIVTLQGKDFIFIVTGTSAHKDNKEEKPGAADHSNESMTSFQIVPVAKGTTDVGYTEITLLQEIPKDAKIVTKGAFFVMAKMTNSGSEEH